MIPAMVTIFLISMTVWFLAFVNPWLSVLWLSWLIVGIMWFIASLGRKGSPGRWYDGVLLAPVLPYAWIFGQVLFAWRWIKERV